jgi:hypothetical protein
METDREDISNVGWDRLADWVTDNLFEAHRGAFHHPTLGLIAFGNDGYEVDNQKYVDFMNGLNLGYTYTVGDPRLRKAKREVELFRAWLPTAGYEEVGFSLDAEGHAWVMRLRPAEVPEGGDSGARNKLRQAHIEAALWDCWREACGPSDPPGEAERFRQVQEERSESALSQHSLI